MVIKERSGLEFAALKNFLEAGLKFEESGYNT
jgi:hypothetical protein